MFKSNLSSYLLPQWFKKYSSSSGATTNTGSNSKEPIPSSFVVPSLENKNKLVNISMNENEDSFVDIQCKKMTYAEVASLSKDNQQQTAKKHRFSHPNRGRQTSNTYATLKQQEEDEVLENSENFVPIKSDISYKKSKQFKNKQIEFIQKKKIKKSLYKQSKYGNSG